VTFEEDQFPEGLTVAPDGTIHVGILSTGEILRVTPNGSVAKFAQIPLPEGAILVGLAAADSTNVYALVFSNDENNGVWYVSAHGASVSQVAQLPVGSLPNGLVLDGTGHILVTDTIGGRVFRVQPTGEVEVWAADPSLLGNVDEIGPLGFPIGANGIVMAPDGDAIYVAVSEKARLVRIPINEDGSAGDVAVVAEDPALGGADGIDVGPEGAVYVAVNGQNQIAAVDPETGKVDVVASGSLFRFPATPRFSPDFETLYVTNFEGLVFFGLAPGPAAPGLLAIDFETLTPQPSAITPPVTGSAGLADR
jgi:sugar lactone lactonase YvrE